MLFALGLVELVRLLAILDVGELEALGLDPWDPGFQFNVYRGLLSQP
jgi:hypothetical protein